MGHFSDFGREQIVGVRLAGAFMAKIHIIICIESDSF
jgi:hypothetical protein